jgi:O-antigen ligase
MQATSVPMAQLRLAPSGLAAARVGTRFLERALSVTVFLTMLLTTLVYQPGQAGFMERMLYPKSRVSAAGALASVTLLLLLVRQQRDRPMLLAYRRWAVLTMTAIGILILAVLCSPDPCVRGLLWVRLYLCTFAFFCVTLLHPPAWRVARAGMMASAAILASQLLLEEFGWRWLGIGDGAGSPLNLPPAGSFAQRNLAANVLLAPFLFAIADAAAEPRRRKLFARLALLALLTAGLAATRCRTVGIACLLGGGAVVAGHRALRRAVRARALPLALAVTLGVAAHAVTPMSLEHEPLLAKILWTRLHEPNLTARYALWSFALEQTARHPLLGVGSGEFQNRWLAAHPEIPTAGGNAHNTWLQIGAELGLANVLMLLLLVIQIGRAGRVVLRSNDTEQAPPVAALLAFLVASVPDILGPVANLHVGAVAGTVVRTARERERSSCS